MKTSQIPLLLLSLFTALSFSAEAQNKSRQLNAMILQGMEDWKVPGLVAVVVQDGRVVFEKAYGVRNREEGNPTTPETLFNMGSTTKAVVCMALGILVDQGKLDWEDKVYEHLPAFELSDPYLREEARVKDLLTHNLGIAADDLLWIVDSTSTEKVLERFALTRKAYPVRGGYQYNNIMYAVAGEVIGAVSGQHWSDFVREQILEPLEMNHTVTKSAGIFDSGNFVTPYLDHPELGLVRAPYWNADQIGAAGMIWTSLDDVGNYLKMLTSGGVYKGNVLLKPETFAYLFKPHALLTEADFYPTQQLTRPNWRTYGLGWFQHDYRGLKLDFHTGSLPGLIAIAGVLHDRKTAVYVMANQDHAELRHAILYKAMDLWAFDDNSRDWHAEVFNLYQASSRAAARREFAVNASRIEGTSPTHNLGAYEGKYENPRLGVVTVRQDGEGLTADFNSFLQLRATHWHYDTFRSDLNNRRQSRTLMHFGLGATGSVDKLTVFGEDFSRE